MTTSLFAFAGSSASACFIISSPSAGLLLPVVLYMTKFFHKKKSVTSTDNTTTTKILKGIIKIAKVLFFSLDKTWQYILDILDPAYQFKVMEDIVNKQVLLTEIIGFKHETMARLLKRNWKAVGIVKETMTNLIRYI